VDGKPFLPARPAFDDEDSLRKWEHVLALPVRMPPPAERTELGPDWLLAIGDDDIQDPALVETLVRAQQVSGADIVSCGVFVGGKQHLFMGEPRGLGLLANGYGTVALIRRTLVDGDEPMWPRLARLSVSGAKIVSVPTALVTQTTAPATLQTHPAEGRLVFGYFEQALPQRLRYTAELAARLAAATERPGSTTRRSLPRRAVGRLLRRIRS
jgi:hypothetical protein